MIVTHMTWHMLVSNIIIYKKLINKKYDNLIDLISSKLGTNTCYRNDEQSVKRIM